ncbi:damage-control phosphatase ARMT1 family protein [Embleya sp. NPDC008237]|uniref:damage-control phosphatase ARMT1 family protein n=1 Tax=Embleya sp. NPDC008237 TaxID=3363978 RepID=UPI0036DFF2D9
MPPLPIMWSDPGSYGLTVFHDRHPELVRRLAAAFPLAARQLDALEGLVAETLHGVVRPLPPEAHDAARWAAWAEHGRYYERPWTQAPFLWAESYFYRRLLGAFGYFDSGPGAGPWQGIDPFGPTKHVELDGPAVDEELAGLAATARLDADELPYALVMASLWGNRADLGFRLTAKTDAGTAKTDAGTADSTSGTAGTDSGTARHRYGPQGPLVADDTARLLRHLAAEPGGRVCVVADNAGGELIPDLVLIDHLLDTGLAADVVLHVKPHPYYVSDATPADVLACLRRLKAAPGYAGRVGERLWQATAARQLDVRTHTFACAPLPYTAMPADLRADFASATVTILKGDLNHRRLVGDLHWPPTTPFRDTVGYFPGPVASLRTLKSDVIVGLEPDTVCRLDATEPAWRTSGTHALVQFHAPPDTTTRTN